MEIQNLILIGVTALILLNSWFILRVLLPLRWLARQAEALAKGDFDALQQPSGGSGEIEALRRSMASMAAHVQRAQDQTRTYTRILTEGQEAERSRIARELHDDTLQQFIAMVQSLELAELWRVAEPQRSEAILKQTREQIISAAGDLRRIIGDLRPPALDELGLATALRIHAARLVGLRILFQIEGKERRLSPVLELGLFRIAQEALNNVYRHARAKQVLIKLSYQTNQVSLNIQDDGYGFDVPPSLDEFASNHHYGLIGIQERAQQLKGQFSIKSQPGQGSSLTITLPESSTPLEETVRDPVCSTIIEPEKAYGHTDYQGQRYYFCCPVCQGAFQKSPQTYLTGEAAQIS